MGKVIPLRLRGVVEVREDANARIISLPKVQQRALWKTIQHLAKQGLFGVIEAMPLSLLFHLPKGTLVHGALYVCGLILVIRVFANRLTIYDVMKASCPHRVDIDEMIVFDEHQTDGYLLTVVVGQTSQHVLAFEFKKKFSNGTWLRGGHQLDLAA